MKELNSDFRNAKVGDKVWCFYENQIFEGHIVAVSEGTFPIEVKFDFGQRSFTLDGKFRISHEFPCIFTHPIAIIHADDLEKIGGFKERVMWVSNDGDDWKKRVVFGKVDGFFTAWTDATRIEDVERHLNPACWKFAREINHRAIEIKEQIAALQKELETIENSK